MRWRWDAAHSEAVRPCPNGSGRLGRWSLAQSAAPAGGGGAQSLPCGPWRAPCLTFSLRLHPRAPWICPMGGRATSRLHKRRWSWNLRRYHGRSGSRRRSRCSRRAPGRTRFGASSAAPSCYPNCCMMGAARSWGSLFPATFWACPFNRRTASPRPH